MSLFSFKCRKGLPSLIFLFFTSIGLFAQDLEITGKLKVKQTQKVNTADSVVVRLNDGTFAIRDAITFGGATGNGIANVVDNENGTFTFNFTDGGSFTTSVLTGPQGPPGADGLSSVQALSLNASNLTLSDGGGTVSINDADASPTNEIQTISRVGNTVTLSNGGGSFLDSILTETEVDIMVNNNGYLTSELDAGWLKNQDGTTTSNLVGIGITNPDAELHVVGSIKIVDGSQGDRKILTSNAYGLATWTTEVPQTAEPIPLKYQGDLIYAYPVDNGTNVNWASAKSACTYVNAFGHFDWYLPNLSELNAMYKQSYLITGLDETSSTKYWSDTEKDVADAYALRLDYGGPDPDLKTISANHNARCIRKN
jgi:hypothetical protein